MTDISPSQLQQQQQIQRRETRSSKSKAMIKAIPPSPALSNAEIPAHGLPAENMSEYLQHHQNGSAAYYPHDQSVNMESIHPHSQPATRYSTPVPLRSMYQPSNQQMVQAYTQYTYPQPPHYDQSPYQFTDEYGTASSQPYSTPATSPPTPSRNDLRVTRNGIYPRGGKAATPSRPPPAPIARTPTPKKKPGKDRPKAVKKSPHLSGPMSEITKDSKIPVVDIETYVNRSSADRQHEVVTGKVPGKIKRPMNAFMLYRKAYQNRAKEWCSQYNHQIVSQVCGDSWPMEPEHIRAQFTEWAKIERDNHQKAHPAYKFTPSKPHKPKPAASNKRGRLDNDEDDLDDDPNDPDWHGSSSKRMRRTETPYSTHDDYEPPRSMYSGHPQQYANNRSAFQATNPGKPLPPQYDAHAAAAGHYYQAVQVREGPVEHILYKKTPSPAMMHHQYQPHAGRGGYDEYGGYAAPAPHHQQMHHHQGSPLQQHQYLDIPQTHQHPKNAPYGGHHHPSQRQVDPLLLLQGSSQVEGDVLDLGYDQQYPHQLDPAHHSAGGPWVESGSPVVGSQQQQQIQYLDQTTTYEAYGANGMIAGGGEEQYGTTDPTQLLYQPEQEKIFSAEPWQVVDTSLGAEGDDWMLQELQTPTAVLPPAEVGGK
ncbi:hypothetical protein GE09DRAFT_334440 [Coniochaeta sp. 2T2.1]|nr:hypothetical protein GE09DRAFT_334440 [Coniochaeta sp. 2T2.1]